MCTELDPSETTLSWAQGEHRAHVAETLLFSLD